MKYIIEFEDEPCMREDGLNFYKCIQAPWYQLSDSVIKRLTPYQPEPDCVSRKTALDAFGLSEKTRKYGGDHSGYDTRMLYEIQDTLENLPAAQPDHNADIGKKVSISCGQENDLISRQAAIDALDEQIEQCNRALSSFDISPKDEYAIKVERASLESYKEQLENVPSAQPTLCGYNIEHLILIANVLRKENLPPERVVEALTDIGRIVSIVKDEFEESLRKAVEQCKV